MTHTNFTRDIRESRGRHGFPWSIHLHKFPPPSVFHVFFFFFLCMARQAAPAQRWRCANLEQIVGGKLCLRQKLGLVIAPIATDNQRRRINCYTFDREYQVWDQTFRSSAGPASSIFFLDNNSRRGASSIKNEAHYPRVFWISLCCRSSKVPVAYLTIYFLSFFFFSQN